MRYLNILLFLLLATLACAQRSLPVVWKTSSGIVDSGELKRLPLALYEDDKLFFYKNHRDSIAVRTADIEWVTYRQDTLLTRHPHRGRLRLMRLLYQGDVRLYQVIQPWFYQQYYLVKAGQWYLLTHLDSEEVSYRIMRQNCRGYKAAKRIRNEQQAVEIARQINDCVSTTSHYALPTYETYKHQIGLAGNIPGRRYSSFDDRYRRRNFFSEAPPFEKWQIHAPVLSAYYQRRIFRYRPKISAQINAFLFHTNLEANSILLPPNPAYPVKEKLDLTALYFYPGFHFSTNNRRALRFSLGTGPILALPLAARREITLLNGNTIPQRPISQQFTHILDAGVGYYFHLGTRLRIRPNLLLGVSTRLESLRQRWRYYDSANEEILYSLVFRNFENLAKPGVLRLQAQALYCW